MVLTNVLHLHGRDLCPVNPHWMPVDEHMISHTLRQLGIESSEVFIVDADKCKVKVIDIVSPSGGDFSNHEDTVVKWASSREAMEALLEVSNIPHPAAMFDSYLKGHGSKDCLRDHHESCA